PTGDGPDALVVLWGLAGYPRRGLVRPPAVARALAPLVERVAARLNAWGLALEPVSEPGVPG
ncbi:MAG: hypothetical protein ACM3UV_03290, partial [Nocardioidaceae bacterium]